MKEIRLRKMSYSPGYSDMLGGYHGSQLKKDENGDWIFVPNVRKAVEEKSDAIKAYALKEGALCEFSLSLGDLTDDEREIIADGCLINYYKR